MLVGITGPSGAGKGLAVKVFEKYGFRTIDADKVAREVVMPGETALQQLTDAFGRDILHADGTLNRRLLAKRAFSSRELTDRMNAIMLAEIRARMVTRAAEFAARGENCLFDAPLLFEAEMGALCDCRVAVVAPVEMRIARLAARDGITEEEIRKRISMQHGDDYYIARCEYVIVNDSDQASLVRQTEETVISILDQTEADHSA